MSSWMNDFINHCLKDVPHGRYRRRAEAELRDHMETLRQFSGEQEVLQAMGDPERLRAEYEAAWERSLPGRLEELRHWLNAWAEGWFVMLMAHILACYARIFVYLFVPNPDDSWLWSFLPLGFALIVGAYYLGRNTRISRRPVWQISVGLSFHWAFIFAFDVWWEATDDHMTFLEELWVYLTHSYTFRYYSLTLAFCVLLGVVFGLLFGNQSKRRRELA